MMKKLKVLGILVLSMVLLAGCSKDNAKNTQEMTTPVPSAAPTTEPTAEPAADTVTTEKMIINIAALKGPTAIGMVKVREDSEENKTTNNYKFTTSGTADEISAGLVQGSIDIAAIPCNLASALYNKTNGKIKVAGINTLGVLYIVETGDTIHSIEDLKGKTIYSTGLGTTPQYTLNYILNAHGINPDKDVTVEYKTEPQEVATILSKSDKDTIAMLPQPFVTVAMLKNSKLRIALNVSDEWDAVKTDKSSVVTGVVVVRSEFLDKNKEAFDAFMQEYTASASFVNENIDEASALVGKFEIFDANVAKAAIPNCNITMIQGNEMKEKISGYLTALFNQNPKSVGGKLPADDFYYIP